MVTARLGLISWLPAVFVTLTMSGLTKVTLTVPFPVFTSVAKAPMVAMQSNSMDRILFIASWLL
jgi:hypothetical protein